MSNDNRTALGCLEFLSNIMDRDLDPIGYTYQEEFSCIRDALTWRPMESAPKGGGAEYVTHPDWEEPPQILIKFEDAISVGRWDWYYADGGAGCTDGVAWIEPVSGEPLNQHYGDPVGWMPLPETDQ